MMTSTMNDRIIKSLNKITQISIKISLKNIFNMDSEIDKKTQVKLKEFKIVERKTKRTNSEPADPEDPFRN